MRLITSGISPAEFILILNENFSELAEIRKVEAFETLTTNLTTPELITAVNSYFGSIVMSIGMTGTVMKTATDNAFANEAGAKSAIISSYQNSGESAFVAGYDVSTWEQSEVLSMPENPAANLNSCTIINRNQAIRQRGYIRSFDVHVNYLTAGTDWAFKILNWNGTGYECKASENFTPLTTGLQSFTLASPINVIEGDIPALFVPAKCAVSCGSSLGYPVPKMTSGNIEVGSANSFLDSVITSTNPQYFGMYLTVYSHRPYAVFIGDSIFGSGNNYQVEQDGRAWHTELEAESLDTASYHTPGGKPGDINLAVAYRISKHLPPVIRCQNFAKGGSIMSELFSEQITRAVAANSKAVIIHCGINDLLFHASAPRSWVDISTDLDNIRTAFPSGTLFYLDEILPSTNKPDADCVRIRQMNAHYADYCNEHGWTLIPCHDEMGIIKASTGLYDDINPDYQRGDNLHLNGTGADKLAEIISRYV